MTARPPVVLAVAGALLVAAPTAASARTVTLEVRSQLERAQLVDAAPAGDSAGDLLVFTERLLDRRGRRIGSDAASCVRLFDERSLCTVTYALPGGQVTTQLLQPGLAGVRTYDLAITGGTGRFAGARGTVRLRQGEEGGDRLRFRMEVRSRSGKRVA
jgi:hypothetical protein